MRTELGEQNRSNWRPIGALEETLGKFDAPVETRRIIARRVGNLAGTSALPISDIQNVIEESMRIHGGMPNWQIVTNSLADIVTDAYRKFKRY